MRSFPRWQIVGGFVALTALACWATYDVATRHYPHYAVVATFCGAPLLLVVTYSDGAVEVLSTAYLVEHPDEDERIRGVVDGIPPGRRAMVEMVPVCP